MVYFLKRQGVDAGKKSTLQNPTESNTGMSLSVPFVSLICSLGGLLSNIYGSVTERISFPAPDPIFMIHNLVISNSFTVLLALIPSALA